MRVRPRNPIWIPIGATVLGVAIVAVFSLRDGPRASMPPSIILISIDTLRADHLSAYGYSRPTPNLDALARGGARFTEAHSPAPWTLPSHMSLITGRYPTRHGVLDDGTRLADSIPVLAELLQRRGYRTAGFVSHAYLDTQYGFARGFDRYWYEQYVNTGDPDTSVTGEVTINAALRYLDEEWKDGQPGFLFVHLFDPHWTYAAPPPFRGRYSSGYEGSVDGSVRTLIRFIDRRQRPIADADLEHLRNLYDEEVAYVDALVGRLVEGVRALPSGERALFIVTADHGEEFMEHGSLGHGITLYREQSHVPLIVSGAAIPRSVIEDPVSTVDIAPTIYRLADIPEDDPLLSGLDGVPLQTYLQNGSGAAPGRPIVMETTRWGPPRTALMTGGLKAISPAQYDWIGNPLPDGRVKKEVVARWKRRLEIYDHRTDPGETQRVPLGPPTEEVLERLARWRDGSWRGVLLELRVGEGFRARVTLPETITWIDEPQLEIGHRRGRVVEKKPVVPLLGLPAGVPCRLRLPVTAPPGAVATLTIDKGSVTLLTGTGSIELGPGANHAFVLDDPQLADAALAPETAAVVRLRTRSGAGIGEALELDPETRALLDSLGYIRR